MNLVLIGMLSLAALAAQSLELGHPDAKALIGIDVRSLRHSSLGQVFGDDIRKGGPGIFAFPGMALLDEIDRVFVSSPGTKAGAKKGNPPVLIVATGHFSPGHVSQLLHGPHHAYRGVDVYSSSKDGSMSIALLDESTLLLGDEPSLVGAIDRHVQGSKNSSAVFGRAAAMSPDRDLWLIATVSPSAFQPSNMNLGRIASDIHGIDAGFSLRDGLDFEVAVLTKTPEIAHELGEQFSTLIKDAVASKLDKAQASDLARKLQISSDGSQLRVKFALTKDELEGQIRTMRAARAAAPRNTIKILGLDDGVREIPIN